MPTIPSYPRPAGISGDDLVVGWFVGETAAPPISQVAGAIAEIIGSSPALVTAIAALIVSGQIPFSLPDEANGDAIPMPGSGLPYLSGGALKIA